MLSTGWDLSHLGDGLFPTSFHLRGSVMCGKGDSLSRLIPEASM